MVTGKAKPTAAKLSVPNKLINQVSTKLKKNTARIPTTMGRVSWISTVWTGAVKIASRTRYPCLAAGLTVDEALARCPTQTVAGSSMAGYSAACFFIA
ncbi:hypothetical protein GCM10011297_27760 [Bacterioplanes sanyensis]|nr:hypothetical protein GCM10011297_27760 [Bacterioplanes sanyensis]